MKGNCCKYLEQIRSNRFQLQYFKLMRIFFIFYFFITDRVREACNSCGSYVFGQIDTALGKGSYIHT